jgi:hypothetical protein
MKFPAALLILIVASEYLHASAGPPPFTNGSPLISGVDGSYQATARGKNLTGVFRFTYSGGRQTSNPQLPTGNTVASLLTDPYNDYVFFVEGLVFRGLVQANINVNSVAGVLDNGGANVPNFGGESNPTPTPAVSPSPTASPSPTPQQSSTQNFLRINAFMNGFFHGTIDQNSPFASFHGKGEVTVTGFTETEDGGFSTTGFFEVKFRFCGVRNATGTSTSSTTTTTSGSTTSF